MDNEKTENSVEYIARIELHKVGSAKKPEKRIRIVFHEWSGSESRKAGLIEVEGADGSYSVNVVSDGQSNRQYVGGLEHALLKAWKLRAEYVKKGCA